MRNEYTTLEVIEIGEAQELILGGKEPGAPDIGQFLPPSSLDLDE
jgi:hypothetical protein